MGNRRRVTRGTGFTSSLDAVVTALCRDYGRRIEAISGDAVSSRCAMEYKYLNYRIYEGAAEVVGELFAGLYITEIGEGVGYARTAHPAISESAYKEEKLACKINIARKLHLID